MSKFTYNALDRKIDAMQNIMNAMQERITLLTRELGTLGIRPALEENAKKLEEAQLVLQVL